MNSFFVFTQKELTEQLKSFKGVVIFILMMIFGISSPLLAKLTPEILKSANLGVDIKLPAVTSFDGYAQFFKNISQMGLIIIILIFCTAVVSETSKGTTALILTKRLSRAGFVLSKFVSAFIVWTVSYTLSALLCMFYTSYLFDAAKMYNLFLSLLCMWLFGVITIAIAILTSTVFKNYALAAVASFILWGLLLFTSAFGRIKDYTPAFLASANMDLLAGKLTAGDALVPILGGILLTAVLLAVACLVLQRREL